MNEKCAVSNVRNIHIPTKSMWFSCAIGRSGIIYLFILSSLLECVVHLTDISVNENVSSLCLRNQKQKKKNVTMFVPLSRLAFFYVCMVWIWLGAEIVWIKFVFHHVALLLDGLSLRCVYAWVCEYAWGSQ